jgi:nucleotide-binding universal stress UspA family protein
MDTTPTGTVLVGIDGSENSLDALRWASAFAQRAGLSTTAVMAWDYPPVASEEDYDRPEAVDRDVIDRLRDFADAAGAGDVACEALHGPAHRALVEATARPEVAALVLTTRGLGPIMGMLLGSVTRSLLFKTRSPLIIVPPGGAAPSFEHVVVGVDGSPIAEHVASWSAGTCRRVGARATVLQCIDPGAEHSHEFLEEIKGRAHRDLDSRYCAAFRDAGVHHDAIVTTGDPRRCLVDVAGERKAGLIVIGQHGAGRFDGLGGTGSYLSRHSPLPLGVVPPPKAEPGGEAVTGG